MRLTTLKFATWNKLHYLIVFSPIPIVVTAIVLAQLYL